MWAKNKGLLLNCLAEQFTSSSWLNELARVFPPFQLVAEVMFSMPFTLTWNGVHPLLFLSLLSLSLSLSLSLISLSLSSLSLSLSLSDTHTHSLSLPFFLYCPPFSGLLFHLHLGLSHSFSMSCFLSV